MSGKDDHRIFIGGLSWDVTERQLEHAFISFGKILECQIMLDRDSGRPRGFGFITFSDRRAMDEAIREMNGRELGDRPISVNKAQPRMGGEDDLSHGHRGGSYSSGGRGSFGGGGRTAEDECFKCGRPGHWARDCPSAGGGRGGLSSQPRFSGTVGRGDRFGDRDRFGDQDRFIEDRYDGGRYGGDRDRFDSRDKYGTRDRIVSDRYPIPRDRFAPDSYGSSDRYPQNGYGKERGGYDIDVGPRGGSGRYGTVGAVRDEGRGYRSRPGPYDRPARGGRPSFDRY